MRHAGGTVAPALVGVPVRARDRGGVEADRTTGRVELGASPTAEERAAVLVRAAFLWPGLDPRLLRRTGGDPRKVARLVGRRTIHGEDVIVRILLAARRGS